MAVFVLDRSGKPLMPCSERRARLLLARGHARVHLRTPFTIRLIDRDASSCAFQKIQIKLDPGSQVTGVALVRETDKQGIAVLNLFELMHRGRQISKKLTQRSAFRGRRRSANLRYRAPRFDNRRNPEGWLAPSLQHRVDTTTSLVNRLRRLAPVTSIVQELVRFDMQAMENPEISGVVYQHGTLAGYEVREYLLEQFGRKCCYGDHTGVPLNIDHVHPRSKGGTNRISNLVLSCISCNLKKSNRDVREFLAHDSKRLEQVLAQIKRPLKDTAAVSSTRWALFHTLKATGLPVSTASGGRTKFNRHVLGIPKTHALDAVCVGLVSAVSGWRCPALVIKATGRGSYQRTRLTAQGFPRGHLMRAKQSHGFRTGDLIKAVVPSGKKAGAHIGRVAIRATGSFNIQAGGAVIQGVSHKYCQLLQRADGYSYFLTETIKNTDNAGKINFPVSSPSWRNAGLVAAKGGVSTGDI
ncbi:MAG: RNA-guided endonuclease IscB [Acidiferrobacterales bacterium]